MSYSSVISPFCTWDALPLLGFTHQPILQLPQCWLPIFFVRGVGGLFLYAGAPVFFKELASPLCFKTFSHEIRHVQGTVAIDLYNILKLPTAAFFTSPFLNFLLDLRLFIHLPTGELHLDVSQAFWMLVSHGPLSNSLPHTDSPISGKGPSLSWVFLCDDSVCVASPPLFLGHPFRNRLIKDTEPDDPP